MTADRAGFALSATAPSLWHCPNSDATSTAHLDACARRDDGWLFHTILDGTLRDICVAWFAAHGRYLPFHKRLHHWIARFALEADIAALERALWHPGASLPHKADVFFALAERVLALPGAT